MTKKTIFLICIASLVLISCNNSEKSDEVLKSAIEIYLSNDNKLDFNSRIDKSLSLTNKSLDLNSENFQALTHKAVLLTYKKDFKSSLEVYNKIVNLKPNNPYNLAQKAFFLELNGNKEMAENTFFSAIKIYEERINSDAKNLDSWIQYIDVLEFSGNSSKAKEKLELIDKMKWDDYQYEILEVYKEGRYSKKDFISIWKS